MNLQRSLISKSWSGKPNDWQPKSLIAFNAVAIPTNLQENKVFICRSDHIPIRFPFSLQVKQPQNCGFPGFNLSCNDQGVTVLNLPYSGDFLVSNINYQTQQIQVYDSNNCLAGRLLSLNLSGSPFNAAFYQNYTFLRCPTELVTSRFTPINCLSNSTASVLATSSMSLVNAMSTSCDIIDTLPTPVSHASQDEKGFSVDLNDDLKLTWFVPDCTACETRGGICGFKSNTTQEIGCSYESSSGGSTNGLEVFRIIGLSIGVPAIIFAVGIGIFACLLDQSRNSIPAAVTPQPAIVSTGVDESTIESYQKVVLGESRRLPGLNDGSCPICLSEYKSNETLRCLPGCKHCFHADCIDEWLRLNGTCPVCRNSPPHANVPTENV
ncbi:putative RING-H2 finger protein ATL21A [Tripterygium wilfordii]|uniref:putative RING-H2 finger protein ATL21A n=1 Tax=Tripterygium wilfordii TaxID=458696 RepID=UPI0018F80192|nr:putative RING-H2 finger protein ATL21A [Tripterygium wilfordii]